MNIAMLSTLAAILEKGSFAAAANDVGCTPSAVSLQIKQLEAYFGQPLFDRSGRTAKPTAFARQAGAVAHELIGRLEALRAHPALVVSGRVRLGAIATVQTDVLPQALRALRDRYPALEVAVSLDDSDALQTSLKSGSIDVAALVRPQSGGSSRLIWQNLAKQPYVMLVPADAPSGSPRELLQRFDWIRYDTSLTGGQIAARYVHRMLPRARCAMEVRSIDAIVAMVAAGLGVTIVPRPRQQLLGAYDVREVRLGKYGPTRQISLVRRAADVDNRNCDAVLNAFTLVYASRRGNAG
jgi:DNA-binding transcriptional LysR family regulator